MADSPFSISDLRGGVNDNDSPLLLRPNEMTDARNIDFRAGAIGSKRRGSVGISMASAIFDSPVIAVMRHTPTNNIANDELWAIDSNGHIDRRVGGTWQGGVAKVNDFVTVAPGNYDANGVSLHGKFFIAAKTGADRLLVWDGTVLRWAGIFRTNQPSVADTAGAGTYTGTRYFRIRYTQQNGSGVTIRRSEPSAVVVFTPVGNKDGATLTKPAGTEASTSINMEGQTHWEVEASLDNILFYRIATVVVATSTYTDTTSNAVGYSANPLSEAIGEYEVPICPRHVAVDEDRIVTAGSYFIPGEDATVWWTPVSADDGVGNDERIPQATQQFIRFDGLDGGGVTGLVAGVSGSVYVFKRSRIHKMTRTGQVQAAYDPTAESPSRGCTPRGATAGLDQNGVPCVYFTDEAVGLCRVGQRGVEDLARNVLKTWKRRNKNATIHPRILHYPELDQVWYAVPLDAATTPSMLFLYETRYGAPLYHDGLLARIRSLVLFPQADGTLRPMFGTASEALAGGGSSYIHIADTGVQDNGVSYGAYGITRPFLLGGLYQKFGLMSAVLVAAASSATVLVQLIRNFGIETKDVAVSVAPAGTEPYVVRPIDNSTLSELNVVQVRFGDPSLSSQAWSLEQIAFLPRREDRSA